jgi:hypothetical protein
VNEDVELYIYVDCICKCTHWFGIEDFKAVGGKKQK